MKKTLLIMGSLVVVVIVLSLFAKKIPETGTSTDPYGTIPAHTEASETAGRDYQQQEQEKDIIMHATLHTNKGDITLELFTEQTPVTAKNFIDLAGSGFYDGVKFHRVIKGFMIQGGDPLSKDDSMMARWGTGGPGYRFEDEIREGNANLAGTISMANAGPDTNGSQFFINTADNRFLDTKHTVFGRVTGGMDVVRAIESAATGASDRPLEPIIIESITLK